MAKKPTVIERKAESWTLNSYDYAAGTLTLGIKRKIKEGTFETMELMLAVDEDIIRDMIEALGPIEDE